MHITMGHAMPSIETNTRKIKSRLEREGWVNIGGGGHDRYENEKHPGVLITVPRHKEVSPGVARSIAKAAGWT
jgi:predicted RNA binding protein YcfA (HicA-like mRNA interferase family)